MLAAGSRESLLPPFAGRRQPQPMPAPPVLPRVSTSPSSPPLAPRACWLRCRTLLELLDSADVDTAASRGLAGKKPRQIGKMQTPVILSGLFSLFCRNSKCVLELPSPAGCQRLFGSSACPAWSSEAAFYSRRPGRIQPTRTAPLRSCTVQGAQRFVGTETKPEIHEAAACSVLRAAPGWQGWAQLPRMGLEPFPITWGLLTSSRCFTIRGRRLSPQPQAAAHFVAGSVGERPTEATGAGKKPISLRFSPAQLDQSWVGTGAVPSRPPSAGARGHGSVPTASRYLSAGAGLADGLGPWRGAPCPAVPHGDSPQQPAPPPLLRQRRESGHCAVPRPGAATVLAEKGREQEATTSCPRASCVPSPLPLAHHPQPSGPSCALLLPPEGRGCRRRGRLSTANEAQRAAGPPSARFIAFPDASEQKYPRGGGATGSQLSQPHSGAGCSVC